MIDSEDMLFYGFIALGFIVFATLIGLLVHAGLFIDVVVDTCKPYIGEVQIAYKFATGPYKEAGALFTEAHTLLPQYRTIGVYYDDPKKKEPSRLRYIVGLLLSENGTPLDPTEKKLLEEQEFKCAKFPSINHAVQTSFPFSSTLSIIFAIYKVYPALDQYIKMKNLCAHPCIEVYDNEKSKIIFIVPLEKQDDFYVPEVKMEDTKQEDDDHSTVSWEDSASIIRNDANDFDTDSVGEDSSVSISHASNDSEQVHGQNPSNDKPTLDFMDSSRQNIKAGNLVKPKCEEDSDNTSSSFEEIDETDVHSVNVTVSSSVLSMDSGNQNPAASTLQESLPISAASEDVTSKKDL